MLKKIKIIIINNHPYDALGGSEIQCDIIGNELIKLGHDVIYLAIDGLQKEYETPYKVIPIPKNSKSIVNTVIVEEPDIVYWRYNKRFFYKTARLIKEERIPIIFAVSSTSDVLKWSRIRKISPGKSTVRHFFTNIKILLLSRWNYKGFQYVDGITSLNMQYLNRLPVKMQAYIPNSMSIESSEFSWPKPYVFWVANIKAQKRPEVCINVAKKLMNFGVDVLMVGKIQDQNYSYFRNRDSLPKNLYYLGAKSIKEVNGMLKNSICLFHTCEPEGFGNNFIQAWLQGKPTISLEFDPGGLIKDYKLGLVSNNNIQQFVDDITVLIQDHYILNEMGKNAKTYSDIHHNPEINILKLLSFMDDVITSTNQNN